MQPVNYRFFYCDKCGWYYDVTDAMMKAECHDCGNVSVNFLQSSNIKEIYDRLYEIQMDIGVRFCKSVFALNKDLAFWATPEELKDGIQKALHMDEIEKEFRKRRAEKLVEFLRKELSPVIEERHERTE